VLGATGVVFGDIGTSPLYTFSGIFVGVLNTTEPTPRDIVDAFSMIFWMLTLVVGIKYVCLVMRVSHHGEGGTFAMLQTILEGPKAASAGSGALAPRTKSAVVFLAMLGVSLVAGDGCITPAISVLSALEGIPAAIGEDAQVAIAIAILLLIFLMQRSGSKIIGMVAGPVMVVWFLTIAGLGVHSLARNPTSARHVFSGFSPAAFVNFWIHGNYSGVSAWRSLAGVVLSVTGAEALYADLGHFGAAPISSAWFGLVYPCLVLQYMGQAAALIENPEGVVKPFYNAVPQELKWPVLILATFATVVASQAMITGLFSILTQAHALKFLPRIQVLHTNPDEQGQVYIPEANWTLCTMCIAICLAFRSSSSLAGAYGIAVTSTFLVTTCLLWLVLRRVWRWPLLAALGVIVPMLVIDVALWSANVLKIVESGWVPVVISAVLCLLMHTHHWGRALEESVMASEADAEAKEIEASGAPSGLATLSTLPALLGALRGSGLARTEKVAVFLTPYAWRVPRTVGAVATTLGCLPRTIVLLSVRVEPVPFVSEEDRATFKARGEGVFSAILHFGYAEPLTAERFAIYKALARMARSHAAAHPGLAPLAALGACEEPCNEQLENAACDDAAAVVEEGRMATTRQQPQQQPPHGHGPTFVLHNLHYATRQDAGHGCWDHFRIALYSFLVLNARKPIRFFGLEGGSTMEISVVRFL